VDRGSAHEIRLCPADQVGHLTHSARHNANIDSAQHDIVVDLKRQLHDLQKESDNANLHADKCKQTLAQHGRAEKDLQIRMQRAEDHSEALRDALDQENADDGQIDALQNALKEAEGEIQVHEGSFRDAEAAMAAKLQTLKEIMREKSAQQTALETLKNNMHVAESEKKVVESKLRTLRDDKNAAIALIANDKAELANVVQKQELVQERVKEYNEKAGLISSRVPVDEGETPRSLVRKLERLDRDLNRYNTEYVTWLLEFNLITNTTIDWGLPETKLLSRQRKLRKNSKSP
jgi:chromosome segregation ATPase